MEDALLIWRGVQVTVHCVDEPSTIVDLAQEAEGLLADIELHTGSRIVIPDRRNEYLASHVLLRRVLGRQLSAAPSELRFARDRCVHCGRRHGRPVLVGRSLQFSLSRTHGAVLVATSSNPVGVDIERLLPGHDARSIAPYLHPQESAMLSNLPNSHLPGAFATVWTRKEALLKASGEGLVNMKEDSMHDIKSELFRGRYAVRDLPAKSEHRAAVAVAVAVAVDRASGNGDESD